VIARPTIDWQSLVAQARQDKAVGERLVADLQPAVKHLAHVLTCSFQNAHSRQDFAQDAWLRIWQTLEKVDVSRPNHSIRQMLVTTAANAIRDRLRSLKPRQRMELLGEDDVLVLRDRARPVRQLAADYDMPNLLKEYLAEIRKTGQLMGVRTTLAARHGVRVDEMTVMFQTAARRWLAKQNF
jgi:DNA-directed RNA polymerase specialized sigma24 family protein